jgi:peptidyl-prolyl cis-trans isomerase B (cyclophilin B)
VFYRVVPGLVIQGGDSDDTGKRAWKKKIGVYTIPEEMRPAHIHKKGALAMSRYYENNPTKRSSSWDFYIVQGAMPSEAALRTIPEANHETYKKVGGTWHLDGQHTVFGEVIDGFDVIDKIAAVRCDSGDWPYTDVVIHMVVNK